MWSTESLLHLLEEFMGKYHDNELKKCLDINRSLQIIVKEVKCTVLKQFTLISCYMVWIPSSETVWLKTSPKLYYDLLFLLNSFDIFLLVLRKYCVWEKELNNDFSTKKHQNPGATAPLNRDWKTISFSLIFLSCCPWDIDEWRGNVWCTNRATQGKSF